MGIIKVFYYTTKTGRSLFHEWQEKLDTASKAIVRTRIDRVRVGNFGDVKMIKGGNGVCELRISYGPGYRIYFGKKGSSIVVLLIGGDKKSQIRDIEKAKRYWLECEEFDYE
ncbi:MAG: type II toxin-antitoxin system RelE/ParE family toxin [bacterium]